LLLWPQYAMPRPLTGKGERATGEELGSERGAFPIEKGRAALVVQGKFASEDAEGLGAVLQELVRNGTLQLPEP